ncbi:DUF3349 domain-containing protein [Tomitella cavernea]|uniref:DUF3349 domain-containing protein n=1 Tax=Tomitella cavernea TaxID=1387982 RepID=A0ABP9CBC6_9ACTN|nr:DUF3349 domain-containing protein [Tomitella cavernea]
MSFPPIVGAVVDWLRAGYPEGVPEQDYIPLLALLERRLTHDEVEMVADELVSRGDLPVTKADIQVLITKITNEMPAERDVNRVRAHLVEGGWPLAHMHSSPQDRHSSTREQHSWRDR